MTHRRRTTIVSIAAVLTVIAASIGAATLPQPAARAAVPAPAAGSALISIAVGSDRSGSTTIAGLPGAQFALFTTAPTIGENGLADAAAAAPGLPTCTSDADGDCNFQVPIGNGAGQTPQSTRLWVAPIAAPAGYYSNQQFQTAPLTGGVTSILPVRYQTPGLVAGQTYRSGQNWMTDPGQQTSPANNVADFTRRVASNGVWLFSRTNPAMPAKCGVNLAFVVDLSSSMTNQAIASLKTAMNAIVNGMTGTPSQAALVTFGSDSPAAGFAANSGLQSIATSSDANAFTSRFSGWTSTPTNYTNWDRGFAATSALNAPVGDPKHIDLALFLTDGNPTVYGPNAVSGSQVVDRNSGYTRFKEMNNGIASANLLKSQSTRVLAVGVGTNVQGAGTAANLSAVSGQTAFDGSNIATADYLQTTDYNLVAQQLRSLVLDACAPSVTVIKRIVPEGWTPADGPVADVAFAPTEPWSFTATADSNGYFNGDPATTTVTQQTDVATGGTSFDVDVSPSPGQFTIGEDTPVPAGYTYLPDQTVCTNVNPDTPGDVPVTAQGPRPTDFTITLPDTGIVSCTVYNQIQTQTASVEVHKRWNVVTHTAAGDESTMYLNGTQPLELQASATLTGPGAAGATAQQWDVPRGGYSVPDTVTVGESFNNARVPGCTLTEARIAPGDLSTTDPNTGATLTLAGAAPDQTATSAAQSVTAADPAINEWTVTNTITCESFLTLRKEVHSGSASPTLWNLSALGDGTGFLPGPDGVTGTAAAGPVEVTPNNIYELREDSLDAAATENYRQVDVRTVPLQFPNSSGSWACSSTGAGPRSVTGNEGAVSVPLGQSYVCVAVNNISTVTIIKNVNGGTASPSDFTFTFTPLDRDLPGPFTMTGAAAPGNTSDFVPNRRYLVTETSGPPGYQLTSLHCLSGTTDLGDPATDGIIADPGAEIICTATNDFTEWTYSKSSDPTSGTEVQPGSLVTYTLTAQHVSGAATSDVTLTDDLSDVLDDATFVASSATTATTGTTITEPSGTGTTLTWVIPSLSSTITLSYEVRIDDDAWSASIRNVVTGDTGSNVPAEPCPPTNADCRTTVVTTPETPTWTITKSSDPADGSEVQPGDTITYTITARHLTGVAVPNVTITDDLSDVLDDATFVTGSATASAPAGTTVVEPTGTGTTLTWTIPSLDSTLTLSYRVIVDADAWSSEIRNVVTGDNTGGIPLDPCDPAQPDCRVTVANTPEEPVPPTTPSVPPTTPVTPTTPATPTSPAAPPVAAPPSGPSALAATGIIANPGAAALLAVAMGLLGWLLVTIARRRKRNS